ncbi:hypothetical protein [Microbacterium sp. CFBP 8794]|uniref:hypothetical protein n=1 Tax=Microbacterium sp. CFBP 8794 TaxID=2775269 RepID=UPI00177A991B|nr:hypothetical protein [Microbacterium sp. CFBP 8794]MBD8478771.1 hypothetical protein [Microbacterium sp. CFBP 8794]
MRLRTTSTQRTYRYVRLALIGATVLLALSVGIEIAGGDPLPSISSAYYTPAGPVFVGALSAIALALLALSGRSLEQALLDVAAVLALAIAYLPTAVAGPGSGCPGATACVPDAVMPTVVNNAVAVASVVLLGVIAALILARVQGTTSRGVTLTAATVAALVVAGAVWAGVSPTSFFVIAHEAAAVGFFLLVAAVAALAAWRPHPRSSHGRGVRLAYGAVAAAIVLTLAVLVAALLAGVDTAAVPVILWGEAVAVGLFAVFWLVQTIELWNEVDPTLGP